MFPQPGQIVAPTQTIPMTSAPVRTSQRRYLGDELHVWMVSLAEMQKHLHRLQSNLSIWEQKKAQSLPYAKDRDGFVIGRGSLRRLLTSYLAIPPNEIRIGNNAFGKPQLVEDESGLAFNLAQSGNFLVIAFCRNRRLGIDLELIDPDVDALGLMKENFSAFEMQAVGELPYYLRVNSFYKTWTQKEAYLKARGEGYLVSSKSFCVDVDPRNAMAMISSSTSDSQFQFCSIDISPRYCCAVALEKPNPSHVRLFRMT